MFDFNDKPAKRDKQEKTAAETENIAGRQVGKNQEPSRVQLSILFVSNLVNQVAINRRP